MTLLKQKLNCPKNKEVPKGIILFINKGIEIPTLSENNVKLLFGLKVEKDIMDNEIKGLPSIGAILPSIK